MSFNTDLTHDQIAPTLNIIGIAVTSMLKSRHIERKSAQIEKDLDKAREIQRSILPEHELRFHNYEMFGVSVADRVVGGDFFDYIVSDDNDRVSIVIGDRRAKEFLQPFKRCTFPAPSAWAHRTKQKSLHSSGTSIRSFTGRSAMTGSLLFLCRLINDKHGLCVYVNAGIPIQFSTGRRQIQQRR